MIESGYDKYGLIDLDTENRIKFHYTQKILDDLKNSITAEIDSEKYVLEIEEEIRKALINGKPVPKEWGEEKEEE